MKKKIFFIMSTNDFSGAEAVNFKIIEGLRDSYDFYWVSKRGKINNFLKNKNIKYIEIKKLSINEVKRVVKKYHPDILHATDYKASTICALANLKIPLISHLHNNSPWLKKICINSIAMLYFSIKSRVILTVSDSIEKEYVFSRLIQKKFLNISNPVDRSEILKKVNNDDYLKEYDICCVGRLTPQKNPFKFIDIIYEIKKEIPNIKCVWVGKGELEQECIEKRDKLNLNNNINFIGFKDNPYKFMAKSKIFILTSDWEGYGLVAFEAITLGLPAIVSNVGGLPNIVDNECGQLCSSTDEFINSACELLKNDNLYQKKSNAAKVKAKKLDNYNSYLENLKNIYEKLVNVDNVKN